MHSKIGHDRHCLADRKIVNNPYLGKDFCKHTHGDVDDDPQDRTLRNGRAESIDRSYREAKQIFLEETKAGL